MKYVCIVLLLSLASNLTGHAGEFNPDINIGDAMPTWKDLPGVDGKDHSAADLKDAKAVVVVFTCCSCPYAVDAEDRLVALAKRCKEKGVAMVAFNVNKIAEDLLPSMKKRAKEKEFSFPFLFDETQKIAKAFGARYTPESFVFDAQRKLAYMGSLDDNPDGRNVKKKFVEEALEAVLSGSKLELTETVPIGCRIRFDRVRRTRKVREK